ncbi:uncharacterized protein MONOS_7706 [Monocercomonoides exilis]|uniref:uncharacterized protein n=1 Tax=Monocercomonoides exilis TaxID=2049356 RepID=UPI003559E778|nr:hypothetical protein MONOS_7706 [Monocercomonoides exilis]|eukprot:MONOS_7706.1-p1 / transcript=MONOS_7706.1 / gene=MONOS_7706 / organism=Monocercomonoides_exilis_PA203 / gene_product=unspecified product / transcript_product=unspecified product / location=Mono_scaffold00270:37964-39658(-) / protein_length=565 / sequence_SO=supercontig / SO=protein_coding / is_pseudo=false
MLPSLSPTSPSPPPNLPSSPSPSSPPQTISSQMLTPQSLPPSPSPTPHSPRSSPSSSPSFLLLLPSLPLPPFHPLSPSPSSFSSSSSFSSFSSPSPSPSISSSSSSSPLHIHRQSHPHIQIHLNLHLSNTLFSDISSPQSLQSSPSLPSNSLNPFISTSNTNTNTIPSFSLHSSLSIHSAIFLHTHNPIDGAILPSLNSPSTSLSAFNTSFLHQTRSLSNADEVHIGNESQRVKLGRLDSFDLNSHRFEWCIWENSGNGSAGGTLYVSYTNANLAISSCSFSKCSTSDHGGALYCDYLLKVDIAKSNFTSCSAANGGANCIRYPQTNSAWTFSENRVESCSITSWCGTGWFFALDDMPPDANFLFKNCVCVANTGGDAAGAVTFNWLPPQKPKQCLLQECQFINNKVENPTSYGGTALCCTRTSNWMNGINFITFCFFDGNTATNGRGNDVFFSGSSITQSPFNQCGSTTESKRVWNAGTADDVEFNKWLPLITTFKIVSNNGTNTDACGRPQQTPCKTIEFALVRMTDPQDASLTLLTSIFVPIQTLTFSAVDTKTTGNNNFF